MSDSGLYINASDCDYCKAWPAEPCAFHRPKEALFDMEPVDFAGREVVAQTIWGDETGVVVEVEDGLATVELSRGDRITISPARLRLT